VPETLLTAVIDDDEALREALCELLRALELPCRPFADGSEFLASPDCDAFGCIIADLRMPSVGGVELQAALAARALRIPFIIMTSHISGQARARALAAGARAVLIKPFSQDELIPLIRAALSDAERS
jgi:FixJ family two-component response regulator